MPVVVADDLTIAIVGGATRITPGEGFRLAEALIRTSTRRCLIEEAAAQDKSERATRRGKGGR